MKKALFLVIAAIGFLMFASAGLAVTKVAVLVDWPTIVDANNDGTDDCTMTADDDVNKLPKDSPTAIGTATGTCLTAYTSGKAFDYGHRGIRTHRTTEGCNKTIYYHSNVNTTTGGPGMFSAWVLKSPTPCVMASGQRMHIYEVDKP